MLVRSFNLSDIKKYEESTGNNILQFFSNINIANLLDLVSLGNGYCSVERAAEILDRYFESGGTIFDAMIEIKNALIGTGDNSKEDDSDNDSKIDISKYESLTDLYINFSMQLMSVGLSYQEFWSMNTKEMYKVFNSIAVKIQNDTNRELSNYHTLAAMVGGAVWGKLQKDPPRISIANKEADGDVEGLSTEEAVMLAKLKSFAASHNKKGD